MIGKTLNKIYCRLFNRTDLYLEYMKKVKPEKSEAGNGKHILIAPVDARFIHTWEGVFAVKARLKGYQVHALLCGNGLEHCDYLSKYTSLPNARCLVCREWAKEFTDAFHVNPLYIKDRIKPEEKNVISEYIETYFRTLGEKHLFLDVDVDELLRSGLQRYYLMADPAIADGKIERQTLQTILQILSVMDQICREIRPEVVVSSHGVYSTWGPVVEYCKAHKIYCVTYGRSYNKNGMTFAYDNSYLKRDLEDQNDGWDHRELSEEERRRVEQFFNERIGRREGAVEYDYNKNNKKLYTRKEVKEILGIPKDSRIAGLFPNIPWDGQVSGEGDVFPRYQDWLKVTLDYFAGKNDIYLVLRTHPAEKLKGFAVGDENLESMVKQIYPVLPPNIIILPCDHSVNSYSLGMSSDFGIAYSSTVCMELTFLDIPMIIAGYPEFGKKGIMYDIHSRNEYISLLDRGVSGDLKVDAQAKEKLFKFAHYFFFETIMPETLLELSGEETVGFKFQTEMEVDKDEVLEYMFERMENKEPMNFSSYYGKLYE